MDLFWKIKGWEKQDKHLLELELSAFRRTLPDVKLSPGVTLIRGPRQIGKSTWLKILLSKTLDVSENCFFYSCEELRDYKDLSELINSQPKIKYFFLDEITFVSEWWRSIKRRVDSDRNVHFILTGSNSYDLRKGADLMPGRWSRSIGELELLPMLFDEWLAMKQMAGVQLQDKVSEIKLYMLVGGFPTSLNEYLRNNSNINYAIKVYQQWIMGDVIKLGRQELFMRELLIQLAKLTCSSISLQKLAQNTQIMSYHTVQDYLSILEHAFALRSLYAYDPEKDTIHYKKEKKFYFSDPIVYWAALDYAGVKKPDNYEEQLAETIAAEYLFRKYKRLGYYSNKNGEVDFILGKEMAIEIKWSPVVYNLSKAYKNLNIINKKVWSQQTFFDE